MRISRRIINIFTSRNNHHHFFNNNNTAIQTTSSISLLSKKKNVSKSSLPHTSLTTKKGKTRKRMRALAHLALHRISNRVSRPGSKVWRQFNFLETHRNRQVFFSSTDYSTAKSSKRKTNADLPNLVTHDQMLRLLSDKGGKMVTRAFIVYCQLSNYGAIPMRETSELMLSHCFNVQSALKPLEHLMIYEDFNDMELVRRAFDMCSRGNAPHACQIILKMIEHTLQITLLVI